MAFYAFFNTGLLNRLFGGYLGSAFYVNHNNILNTWF